MANEQLESNQGPTSWYMTRGGGGHLFSINQHISVQH